MIVEDDTMDQSLMARVVTNDVYDDNVVFGRSLDDNMVFGQSLADRQWLAIV